MSQAEVKVIDAALSFPASRVEVYWNVLAVEVAPAARMSGKYKKVDLQSKLALVGLVKNGASIISVTSRPTQAARSLKINYSTAKSIFQNIKAKATGKLKRKRFVETDSEPTSEPMKEEHAQST